jgi:hypothetical protein
MNLHCSYGTHIDMLFNLTVCEDFMIFFFANDFGTYSHRHTHLYILKKFGAELTKIQL